MTKKPLPPERKIENDNLKALYDAKKKDAAEIKARQDAVKKQVQDGAERCRHARR